MFVTNLVQSGQEDCHILFEGIWTKSSNYEAKKDFVTGNNPVPNKGKTESLETKKWQKNLKANLDLYGSRQYL